MRAEACERKYIPVDESRLDTGRSARARDKAAPQLGSVGGGNHFVEMQVDAADGSVWVMIHCGSRGYGWQTANHYFYAGAEARGLAKHRREDSWLRIDEPLGAEYWAHHNSAANYAVANRHVIVAGVQVALQDVFGARGEVFYEISHNLVQEETLVLRQALEGGHGAVIRDCLSILGNRFAGDDEVEGYRKDGPIAVARFELGENDAGDQREARILRQREVSSVIEELLVKIG